MVFRCGAESIMEEALLPPVEDFPDAEERRLMYVALTRARHRVWALFNKENPSPFVEILKNLDVPVAKTVRNRWRLPPVQYYFRRSAR